MGSVVKSTKSDQKEPPVYSIWSIPKSVLHNVQLLNGMVQSVYKYILNALCISLEIVTDPREVVRYLTVKI